jgi:glycosyltransferase involved in cell wall biosynthesis
VRIGLAIEYFDPRRGGAEWWTYQHAEHLVREGFEVHVVAQEIVPAAQGLPIIPHPLGRIVSPLMRAEAAETVLRSLNLDLIHDMGMGWYCDLFAAARGLLDGGFPQENAARAQMAAPLERSHRSLAAALSPAQSIDRKAMRRRAGFTCAFAQSG